MSSLLLHVSDPNNNPKFSTVQHSLSKRPSSSEGKKAEHSTNQRCSLLSDNPQLDSRKRRKLSNDVASISNVTPGQSIKQLKVSQSIKSQVSNDVSVTNVTGDEHCTSQQKKSHVLLSKSECHEPSLDKHLLASSRLQSLFGDIQTTTVNSAVFSSIKIADAISIHPFLRSVLADRMKLNVLTVVQHKCLPLILSGKDVLIKSMTGSGKSLAFCLPIVHALQAQVPALSRSSGVKALIICPTRELALQTYTLLCELLKAFVRIVCGLFVGGTKRKAQKHNIKKGVNIVVATPHRLLDHIEHTSQLDLSQIDFLVIDEADRLTEMGYEKDIRKILSKISFYKKPQTLLCSATLSAGVERLAGLMLHNPEQVEDSDAIPESIQHYLLVAPAKLRLKALLGFLRLINKHKCKAIVFLPTQNTVDFHHLLLDSLGLGQSDSDDSLQTLFRLHGGMDHLERCEVFAKFAKPGQTGILITTDVCSRGIDLPHVDWIVQYNSPGLPRDYLHRIGRTARIGAGGKGLLFLQPQEAAGYVELLSNTTTVRFSRLDLQEVLSMTDADYYQQVVDLVGSDSEMKELAEKAFISFLRSYASFSGELKAIFNFRQLHLGHLASSFCLSETPKSIANKVKQKVSKSVEKPKRSSKSVSKTGASSRVNKGQRVREAVRPASKSFKPSKVERLSEFASGLD